MKEKEWLESYKKVLVYYQEHGNINVTSRSTTVINREVFNIGTWIRNQRINYKEGRLNNEQIDLLKSLGFKFESAVERTSWEAKYDALKEYRNNHGHLCLPNRYPIILSDGKTADLGTFLNTQKALYRSGKLSEEKIKKLESLGVVWRRKSFEEMYSILKKYYEENLDLQVPSDYRIEIDGTEVLLGQYVRNLRSFYKRGKLSIEKIKLLESIGMVWNYKEEVKLKSNWLKMYKEAVLYSISNGELYMNENYKVIRDGKCLNLGTWLHSQRSLYSKGKLNEEQIAMLEGINIEWDMEKNRKKASFNRWLKNYEEACKYYYRFGNLFVPSTYTTTSNGKTYKLGVWINSQRKDYRNNNLSEEKINLLESIGMIWNYNKDYSGVTLNGVLEILKEYKSTFGNLDISSDYVYTFNDVVNFNLGEYLSKLRSQYRRGKVSVKTFKEFYDLGFDWDKQVLVK